MKNIHILPTENYKQDYTLQSGEVMKVVRLGQLILNKETNELSVNKNPQWSASCDTDVLVPHHIYITSDEEIKDEDYCVHTNQSSIIKICEGEGKLMKGHLYLKKIILTTDQDLVKDGIQSIDDEFLEWFVNNPSCEFIDVKKQYITPLGDVVDFCYDNERLNYKIIIPQEEPGSKIMKNIHVLPTEKPSRFSIKVTDGFQGFDFHRYNERKRNTWYRPQHIYITSDEEIKEDYVFAYGVVIKVIMFDEKTLYFVNGTKAKREDCKKIILTTDQDLIADEVQAIDDEFLEWFVKNPTCEFVETLRIPDFDESKYSYLLGIPEEDLTNEEEDTFFVNRVCGTQEESKQILCGEANKFYRCITCDSPCGSEGHYIDKSTISQEQPKQETLEEAAKGYSERHQDVSGNLGRYLVSAVFQDGAKWQAERMYSEEDMLDFAEYCLNNIDALNTPKDLFEQFKKK